MRMIKPCFLCSLALAPLLTLAVPLSATAAAVTSAEAPENQLSRFSLSYVVSFPTVSTASFLDNSISWRGLGVEWNAPIASTPLYVGLSLRWLYFRHDEDQGSITTGNTTVTGRIYRSVDSFPLALSLKYAVPVASSSRVLPFIGLGVGTTYGRRELEVGAFSQNQYGWQFLMAPEAGAEIKLSRKSDLRGFLNVRYDAGFGSDAINAISNISLALGVGSTFD